MQNVASTQLRVRKRLGRGQNPSMWLRQGPLPRVSPANVDCVHNLEVDKAIFAKKWRCDGFNLFAINELYRPLAGDQTDWVRYDCRVKVFLLLACVCTCKHQWFTCTSPGLSDRWWSSNQWSQGKCGMLQSRSTKHIFNSSHHHSQARSIFVKN